MNNSSIKTNLYRKRVEKGLTQIEMANLLQISQTAYQKLETGPTVLISERVFQIADILNIDEEFLVLGYKPNKGLDHAKIQEIRDEAYKDADKTIEDLKVKIEHQAEIIRNLEERLKDKIAIINFLSAKSKDISTD